MASRQPSIARDMSEVERTHRRTDTALASDSSLKRRDGSEIATSLPPHVAEAASVGGFSSSALSSFRVALTAGRFRLEGGSVRETTEAVIDEHVFVSTAAPASYWGMLDGFAGLYAPLTSASR